MMFSETYLPVGLTKWVKHFFTQYKNMYVLNSATRSKIWNRNFCQLAYKLTRITKVSFHFRWRTYINQTEFITSKRIVEFWYTIFEIYKRFWEREKCSILFVLRAFKDKCYMMSRHQLRVPEVRVSGAPAQEEDRDDSPAALPPFALTLATIPRRRHSWICGWVLQYI